MIQDIQHVSVALKEIRTVLWLAGAIVRYNANPVATSKTLIEDPVVEDQAFLDTASKLVKMMDTELSRNSAIVEMRLQLVGKFNFHLKRIEPALINALNHIRHRIETLNVLEERNYVQCAKFIEAMSVTKIENDFFAKDRLVKSIIKSLSPYIQNTGDAAPAKVEEHLRSLATALLKEGKESKLIIHQSLLQKFLKTYADIRLFKLNLDHGKKAEHKRTKYIEDLPLPLDVGDEYAKLDSKLLEVFKTEAPKSEVSVGSIYKEDVQVFIGLLNDILMSFDQLVRNNHVTYDMIKLNLGSGLAIIEDLIRTTVPGKAVEIDNIIKASEGVVEVDATDVELLTQNTLAIETLCVYLIETDRTIIEAFNQLLMNFSSFSAIGNFLSKIFENSKLNLTVDIKPTIPVPQPDIPLPEIEQEAVDNNQEIDNLLQGNDAQVNETNKLIETFDKEKEEKERKEQEEKEQKEEEKKQKAEEREKAKTGKSDSEEKAEGDDGLGDLNDIMEEI